MVYGEIARDKAEAIIMSRSKRSLNEYIASNPMLSLVATGVAIASVIAGVMTYFGSERVDDLNLKHQAEISDIEAKNEHKLIDVTRPLRDQIQDLNLRLSSIERRLSGTGSKFVDVATVMAGPDAILGLSGRYQPYDDRRLFIAVPPSGNWSYHLTNELEFLKSMYPIVGNLVSASPQFQGVAHAQMHVWQNTSQLRLVFPNYISKEFEVIVRPTVSVERFDYTMLGERVKMAFDAMSSGTSDIPENSQAENTVNSQEIGKQIDHLHDQFKNNHTPDINNELTPKEIVEPTLAKVSENEKILEELKTIRNSNLANLLFMDFISRDLVQQSAYHVLHKFASVQMKGNVFYIQDQMIFPEARITVNGVPAGMSRSTTVDEEIFFFGRGKDGYIVKIILPPVPDRSDDFTWSNKWLLGLQIALE